MTTYNAAQALDLLNRYAAEVGFAKAEIKHFNDAPRIPDNSCLWTSDYAQILSVPATLDEENIRQNTQDGQAWLDVSCITRERQTGSVIDAYLVVVLVEEPTKELQTIIRKIELDSTACRKHFVWPRGSDDPELLWSRIFRVTTIGIPPSPASSGMTNTPKLHDQAQIDLLEDIKSLKPANAARKHGEQVKPVPKR